jgi:hypothetical protein
VASHYKCKWLIGLLLGGKSVLSSIRFGHLRLFNLSWSLLVAMLFDFVPTFGFALNACSCFTVVSMNRKAGEMCRCLARSVSFNSSSVAYPNGGARQFLSLSPGTHCSWAIPMPPSTPVTATLPNGSAPTSRRLQRARHRRIGQRLRNGSRIAVGSSRIRLYIRVCRLRWLLGRKPEWRKKALGFVRPGSFVTGQEPLSLCAPELAKDTSTSKDTSIRLSFLPLWSWGEIS